jgi:hypothetical protein
MRYIPSINYFALFLLLGVVFRDTHALDLSSRSRKVKGLMVKTQLSARFAEGGILFISIYFSFHLIAIPTVNLCLAGFLSPQET